MCHVKMKRQKNPRKKITGKFKLHYDLQSLQEHKILALSFLREYTFHTMFFNYFPLDSTLNMQYFGIFVTLKIILSGLFNTLPHNPDLQQP